MHSLKLKIDFKCTCMSSLLTLNQNFVFWFPRHSPASLSPNSNKKRNFTKFYRPQLGSKIRNRISTIRDVFGCPRRFLAHLSGRYPRPVKFIVCLYTLCFISTSNFQMSMVMLNHFPKLWFKWCFADALLELTTNQLKFAVL